MPSAEFVNSPVFVIGFAVLISGVYALILLIEPWQIRNWWERRKSGGDDVGRAD